ncbi:MAG: ATP-binding protein, partial [Anaerolineales bacterium]|nr:ATP-binding protein [Anaerolineales bacterium]
FEEIYNTFKTRTTKKKINFRYSFDERLKLIVRGDAFRLKQIVINLVSNAVKFTEYGYVELKVKRIREDNRHIWIKIKVSDTGIGISENQINNVFKEYKQASAGIARKHGGTGLGLTISKRLTDMMDGRISVSSTEGKGSAFQVEIPLEKSQLTYLTKDTLQINPEVLSGRSALIVDDDAVNRMLGEIILKGFNIEVDLASDGKEAIDVLRKKEFDMILLDINMPVISGLDVARHIREEKKDRKIKIIAITADMIREELEHYTEYGFDDYLIKPFREINLFNKLCKVMDVDTDQIQHETIKIVLKEEDTSTLFNLHELRSVTKENEAFFNEMIQTFIGNAKAGIETIKNAHKAEDWQAIRETAHRLIPSYKHLEIKTVVSNLIELKNRSEHNPDSDRLSLLITKIEKETTEVVNQLNRKF